MSKLEKQFREKPDFNNDGNLKNSRERYVDLVLSMLGYNDNDPRTEKIESKIHDFYDSDVSEIEAVNFLNEYAV